MENINDIARAAGVSRSTVSRVLNHSEDVSEKTRARVLQVIGKAGYTPNVAARSLARRRNYMLAIVADYLFDPYAGKLVSEIIRAASHTSYSVILYPHSQSRRTFKALYGKVDGIIGLNYQVLTEEEIAEFLAHKTPVVTFDNKHRKAKITEVTIDNYYSAYKATEYLIGQGHRKIGHIYGSPYFSFDERLAGYQRALEDAGIHCQEDWVLRRKSNGAGSNFNDTYENSYRLIQSGVSAVFAFNDFAAMGFITLARELGLRVPEDISVIGFDDISDDLFYTDKQMAITTLHQPLDEIAEYLMQALIAAVETGEVMPGKAFPAPLVRATATVQRIAQG